jgi:aminoglycoside phosphotransferase family enzyme
MRVRGGRAGDRDAVAKAMARFHDPGFRIQGVNTENEAIRAARPEMHSNFERLKNGRFQPVALL